MRMHRLRRNQRLIRRQRHPLHLLRHVLLLLSWLDLFDRYHMRVCTRVRFVIHKQVPG